MSETRKHARALLAAIPKRAGTDVAGQSESGGILVSVHPGAVRFMDAHPDAHIGLMRLADEAPELLATLCDEADAADVAAYDANERALNIEFARGSLRVEIANVQELLAQTEAARDALRAELAEMTALHRMAESRERMLDRELLAIWATVRPGEPTPPGESHVRHAVDEMAAKVRRLEGRVADVCRCVLHIRKDCPDCGGSGAVIVEGDN